MLNLGAQISNQHLKVLTQLSVTELTLGYVVYAVVFLALAVYSFKKRSV
ncbi:hypothetical protein [Lactiplantibacillus garii]|nr:hypothetical protein [Lactiplantibacillus garii]